MRKYLAVLTLAIYFAAGTNSALAGKITMETAEGPMTFKVSGGGAPASENEWAAMTIAGYRFEKGHLAIAWHFGFTAKTSDIVKAEVWDITQTPAQLLISEPQVQFKDNSWYASTDLKEITLEGEPWLSEAKPTLRAYKITLTNSKNETRVLYQLAIFNKAMKLATVNAMHGEDIPK